ncbi:unnamed protein product [Symbiodinium natans]|uniref:Uncharacterized protein n=1 Tax=Symbiodinium natans TaxID=878477 RepID=A0A812T7K8_9DINO|nr:unnamed protein product [Symbiodinium natans]
MCAQRLRALYQELRELFHDEDLELSFSDEPQDGFSERRHVENINKATYDPDADDYEMVVEPGEPKDDDAEKKVIQRQIASLTTRISKGGAPATLDHYQKVKEDLILQLTMRGIYRHKTMDIPEDLQSTLSTISTCDTYPDDYVCIPAEMEQAKFSMPSSGIMGPKARRLSGKEAPVE